MKIENINICAIVSDVVRSASMLAINTTIGKIHSIDLLALPVATFVRDAPLEIFPELFKIVDIAAWPTISRKKVPRDRIDPKDSSHNKISLVFRSIMKILSPHVFVQF